MREWRLDYSRSTVRDGSSHSAGELIGSRLTSRSVCRSCRGVASTESIEVVLESPFSLSLGAYPGATSAARNP